MAVATGTPLDVGKPNPIMTVFGRNFAPPDTQVLAPEVDDSGHVTTQLAGTCVEVNKVRAPVFAVAERQVNFQAPDGMAGDYASLRVIRGCGTKNERASEPANVRLAPASVKSH